MKSSSSATVTMRTISASSTFSACHRCTTLPRFISSRRSSETNLHRVIHTQEPSDNHCQYFYILGMYPACPVWSIFTVYFVGAQRASLGRRASSRSQGVSSPTLRLLLSPSCSSATLDSLAARSRPGNADNSSTFIGTWHWYTPHTTPSWQNMSPLDGTVPRRSCSPSRNIPGHWYVVRRLCARRDAQWETPLPWLRLPPSIFHHSRHPRPPRQ